ncbi:hypothetical protein LPY66_10070 [Dehalobacter sp. DCM]|uniref:hypothetical protein n=1 Tax=Dehalobacter sp. DCM TaxID=2907827 RepID=UPI00308168F9|nr:hypothetical protein LPY66_10070 [Dehalobacter sp. DCM]
MRIQSSNVAMAAEHTQVQQSTVKENLRYWTDEHSREASSEAVAQGELTGSATLDSRANRLSNALADVLQKTEDILELSEAATRMLKEPDDVSESASSQGIFYELTPKQKETITLLERFLSELTGKKVKLIVPDKLALSHGDSPAVQGTTMPITEGNGNQRAGWGLEYRYGSTYVEQESMVFSAKGKIVTEDGQKISFKLDLAASREYISNESFILKAGDALIDPLVINYGAATANLTDTTMAFDLNADGSDESIATLTQGSGFLALDKDSDGQIDNGGELFGPTTGDGFQELSVYDGDENGWIDENDSIFNELRIWTTDEKGNDHLLALAQVGIGAIYLGKVDSLFSLKDMNNNVNGQIKETGIFLKENGEAGTVQHIDLAV